MSIFKNRDKIPENSFGRLGSLKNIISTGCNIPLFVSGLPERKCFNLNNIQWDNYYSPKDILGWPLSILDKSFSGIQDHSINVGNVLTRWNPLCHTAYWSNNKIVKIVADKLRGL